MLQPTRLISTPFAQEGEKTEIQNVTGEFDNSATYRLGFPPLTMQSIRSGGKPPKGTDFNGVLFDITENISFLCKGGRYQYNAGLSTLIGGYPKGSNLLLDDNVTEVVSTVAGNQNNPNTDMTGWVLKPNRTTAEYVADASGETQQQVNYNGGSKWYSRVGGYLKNERVALSNGDIVKSTVTNNTNDPNVDMTGWTNPKEVQDAINQTLQAEVPYSTHPFNTIQEAVDSSPTGNNIHLELKQYSESINLNKNNLIGRGYGTVINVSNNSYGIKSLQADPNWDRMRVSDIAFKGVSRVGTVGFQFDPADPFAGRRNIEYCTFDNLDIGIHKPTGNIGNTYSNISASNSNYGYRAKSSETPLMHAGNDRFVDAQFNSIDKWAIDLENTSGSDGFGQFTVDNSIFQFCAGGGIRLDMGNVVPICPPVIRNTWFEEIAPPNTTVNRDGVDEAPREIKLINCPVVFVEGCYLKNIELINSTMITKGCRIDSAATTYNIIAKDATSQIFADDVYMDGTISTNVTVRSVAKQKRTTGGGNLTFLSTQIRSVTKRPTNALECIGQTFRGGVVGTTTWAVNGSQTVFATCVSDGGEPVAKLPVQTGITNVVGNFGAHAGKWIVWGFSVKPLGQLTGTFKFKNDQDVGNITMIANQWTHNLGIAKVEATGYIAGWIEPTANGELLIKDYFVAEFTKEEDALNFVNSRMSIDTN